MNKLKLITVPYSFTKKLQQAYSNTFSLVGSNDWVCFLDCDTAFLEMPDFGHVLQEYINQYPDTGIFTCYASRCSYNYQRHPDWDQNTTDIRELAKFALKVRAENHLQIQELETRIAGHLVMMKKSTWTDIQQTLQDKAATKQILGFDTRLTQSVLEKGYKVRLMKGVFVFHYFRHLTGKNEMIK